MDFDDKLFFKTGYMETNWLGIMEALEDKSNYRYVPIVSREFTPLE